MEPCRVDPEFANTTQREENMCLYKAAVARVNCELATCSASHCLRELRQGTHDKTVLR